MRLLATTLAVCAALSAVSASSHDDDDDHITTFEDYSRFADANATMISMSSTAYTIDGLQFERYAFSGEGPQWEVLNGIGCVVVPSGQMFRVIYRNNLDEPGNVHAHGMTPPFNVDGVPGISANPIEPNRESLLVFEIIPKNVGTYFIHSHYGWHHARGLSAPLIVRGDSPSNYPLHKELNDVQEVVMMLEDFCAYASDVGPTQNTNCMDQQAVYDSLAADWLYNTSINFDYDMCMEPGTDTDVYFRWHLANNRPFNDPVTVQVNTGATVRLRIINAATMSNYLLDFSPFDNPRVFMTDGQFVKPHKTDSAWIGVAQRLDVLVTVPRKKGAYPVTAVLEGLNPTFQSGIVLVVGGEPEIPPSGTYSTTPTKSVNFITMVDELKYQAYYPLSSKGIAQTYTVNLTGDNGFNSINRRSYQLMPMIPYYVPNEYPLTVSHGERVCVTYINHNADPHAMHIHGHSFQIVNIDGVDVKGAIRDVVVAQRGACHNVTVCFDADNPGVWPLHCHMTYHLAAGMLTTVEYVAGDTTPDAISLVPKEDEEVSWWQRYGLIIGVSGICLGVVIAIISVAIALRIRASASVVGFHELRRQDLGQDDL